MKTECKVSANLKLMNEKGMNIFTVEAHDPPVVYGVDPLRQKPRTQTQNVLAVQKAYF